MTICETLLRQEAELQFVGFGNEDALRLGLIIVEMARTEIKKGIAVHIELDQCPLFTHYMTGTSDNNTYWLRVKKNVTRKYGHSSLYMGELYKAQGSSFLAATGLDKDEFQGEGGAFPLVVTGQGRVGTVIVSGLTGEEDHALAVAGIRRFLGIPS